MPPTPNSPRRLLIVKLGAIGDVVMAIPAAYAMHQRGYAIDWLCAQSVAAILAQYPWINVLAADEPALLRGSTAARIKAMLALWRRLAGRSYTICATLYYDSRYKLLTLPVRAERKVSLSFADRNRALLPGRHHTDEYFRILSGRADGETPAQLAPVRIEGLPAGPILHTGRPRIVLVPAGARNIMRDDALRRWPAESYVELASALFLRGYEVVLAGGPDDAWASPLFAHLPLSDFIGKLTLLQTLALFDSADVTITHDTGPLHLAGLTSTAIVTLFGPTDPHGRLPQRANCVALWGGEGFACRPCYDGRDYAPCAHNGCIRQITPEFVLTHVDALLAARDSGRDLPPRVLSPGSVPAASVPTLPLAGARIQ